MTALSIVRELALTVGLDKPTTLATQTREIEEALVHINAAGEEIVRRGQWGALTRSEQIDGTGAVSPYPLADGVSRLVEGITVTTAGRTVRPLTRAEWAGLGETVGTPRYFLKEGASIRFHPAPAATDTIAITYQTRNWVEGDKAEMSADEDEALVPEDLVFLGAQWRWRRQKAMPYEDYEAEYEAALQQRAEYDDRSRLG